MYIFLCETSVADPEKNKAVWGWLDWDVVNWPVNTGRRSLNPKCHCEYEEMRGVAGGVGVVSNLIHPSESATEQI